MDKKEKIEAVRTIVQKARDPWAGGQLVNVLAWHPNVNYNALEIESAECLATLMAERIEHAAKEIQAEMLAMAKELRDVANGDK